MTTDYWVQALSRLLSGSSQIFLTIFLPVWVDTFAPREKKTRWMTYNITAAPLGLLSGYGITAVIVTAQINWRWSFWRNIMMLLPIACLYLLVKPNYLDIKKQHEKQAEAEQEERLMQQRQQE